MEDHGAWSPNWVRSWGLGFRVQEFRVTLCITLLSKSHDPASFRGSTSRFLEGFRV